MFLCGLLIKTGLLKTGLLKTGLLKTGLLKTGLLKTGLLKTGLLKTGLLKTGLLKSGLLKTGLTRNYLRSQIEKKTVLLNNVEFVLHTYTVQGKLSSWEISMFKNMCPYMTDSLNQKYFNMEKIEHYSIYLTPNYITERSVQ